MSNQDDQDRELESAAPQDPTQEDTAKNPGDDEEAEPGAQRSMDGFEAPIQWRVAQSLETLRFQLNAMAPGRSKASDGGIGDTNHQNRNSDHNPWVLDGSRGVVTARDFTHDPAGGCDCNILAEKIRAAQDSRVKYIIWNKRIASSLPKDGQPAWAWRPYSGKNGHTHHIHISVKPEKPSYDSTTPWSI